MTQQDEGWLRRLVGGGRQREETAETVGETPSLPPAEDDLAARIQLVVAQNTELAEVNGRQAHRLQQLETLVEEAAKNDATPRLEELTAELQTQQRSLRAARSAAEQAAARAQALQQQLAPMERAMGQQGTRAEALEVTNTGLQTQLGPLREQARRTHKQLQFQQEQLELERAQRKELEGSLKQAAARVTELQQRLAASHADGAQHRIQTERCDAELSTLKKQSASLLADLADAQAELQTAQTLRERTLQHLFGPTGTDAVETLLNHHAAALDEASG